MYADNDINFWGANKMKKSFLLMVGLLLVACTIKLSTTINFSDLTSDTNKTIIADLRISVPSCSDQNIQDIQTEFSKRNIRANYNKCSSDDMWNDYASFSVPISIAKADGTPDSDIYFQYINNGLYIKTSAKLASVLDTRNDMFVDKINISSIEFYLVNDTSDSIRIKPGLAFVNERPVYNQTLDIKSFDRVLIKLPDVTNKLLEQSSTEYLIFNVM